MTAVPRQRPSLPKSPPHDRTIAVTVGRWGGFYHAGGDGCWRVCLGFVAVTYLRAEFANVIDGWLRSEGS